MDLEKIFTEPGGAFLTPVKMLTASLPAIKAFVFDWDGVFNNGAKTGDAGSPFSEIDSMGINLLRFSYWSKSGLIPNIFIITGMNNQIAIEFSKREHFDGIFMNLKNKKLALNSICDSFKLSPDEIAYIFDDVIDIEAAKMCRLSFFVNNKSNPLLLNYIRQNKISNYISSFSGEDHAVREICELLTGLNGNYDQIVEIRTGFTAEYENYLNIRNGINTKAVTF
jgi:3-deoxy-D-manno-octulosonate 8-phosphate phosphatase (KDO 8-P phosphatase)